MNLSPHFSLAEMVHTTTGLDNVPNEAQLSALRRLCAEVLEPAREVWGTSVHVNSGFRSLAVNAAIHGSPHSQHTRGEAADVVPAIDPHEAMERLYAAHKAGKLPALGQAIIYASGFLHLSIDLADPRGEFLRSDAAGGSGGPYHRWGPG